MAVELKFIEAGIALLQVDRPEARNALNWDALYEFAAAVEAAQALPELRALLLTGVGETFIAGGDLKDLAGYPTQADGRRLSRLITTALSKLTSLPYPTIAAINGPARGGGVEIALACDLRVMAANADLGFVHINLGLTPGWGGGQRLLHLVGYQRAFAWLAGGKLLSAEEGYSWGVVTEITPAGQALNVAIEMARRLAAQPQAALRALKRVLRAGLLLPYQMAEAQEQAEFAPLWESQEHNQAVTRFLKRKSDGEGGGD